MELRKSVPPAPAPQEDNTRFYADEGGALRSLQPDGTDAPVAGAGVLPDPTDDGDVLTVVEGEWAGAPGGGSMPGAVTILGPFDVLGAEWDAGYDSGNGGIPLGPLDLAPGDLIFNWWFIADTDFTASAVPIDGLQLKVGQPAVDAEGWGNEVFSNPSWFAPQAADYGDFNGLLTIVRTGREGSTDPVVVDAANPAAWVAADPAPDAGAGRAWVAVAKFS